jgi:hypothetical protein
MELDPHSSMADPINLCRLAVQGIPYAGVVEIVVDSGFIDQHVYGPVQIQNQRAFEVIANLDLSNREHFRTRHFFDVFSPPFARNDGDGDSGADVSATSTVESGHQSTPSVLDRSALAISHAISWRSDQLSTHGA